MKAKVYLFFLLLLPVATRLCAQRPAPITTDTLPPAGVQLAVDSTGTDTTRAIRASIQMSKDSLDAPVEYSARDSMKIDVTGQRIHLYGDAKVDYTTISLKAAHIELNWGTSMVTAEGLPDSTGRLAGFPEFAEGERTFTAKRMGYNFETRRGIVYEVVTHENDVIVRGSRSKFISAPPGDTTVQDVIYSEDAIFTTCTAEHPHFGIRSQRQKIVPNELVIIGPSNVEIMGIPTPLWLPFGFFPISKGRRTGLIFPRDYEYSPQWGFGIQNLGWFFPLGDNFNLTLSGNIYLKGTWGVSGNTTYRKRYRYNGSFTTSFDSRREELVVPIIDPVSGETMGREALGVRNNGFQVRWTHNQDPAAHPINRFGGSINFQTNNFQQRVNNDAASVQNNVINSNFSFSRNWTDKPISLSVAFQHTQNARNRQISVDFPTLQFQTQTLYPFRKAGRGGPPRWYDNVNLRYTNEAKARFVGTDTTFFDSRTLEDAQYGVRQNVTAGTSFKLLKYFNLNPGANYQEVWYFKSLEREFINDPASIRIDTLVDANGNPVFDTVDFGTIRNTITPGLSAFRTYSGSMSLNTQIFGTLRFRNGWLRGVRHVVKPSISLNYAPDYTRPELNYFQVVADTLAPNDPTRLITYSPFENGIYGTPPNSTQQFGLSYSITNIFEAKIFSKKDSTARNIKLFDNLYINGNYNFAADSLKWSQVSMRGAARFLKGATQVAFGAMFDPYQREANGRGQLVRVNRTAWETERKLLKFVDANLVITTNLTVGKLRAIFQGQEEEVVENVPQDPQSNNVSVRQQQDQRPRERIEETDFLSLFENFSIRHNLSLALQDRGEDLRDTLRFTANSLEMRGSVQLSPNWSIEVGSIGYDFVSKRITYPFLGFSRDLHCWEMGFNWAPQRNTYSFFLRVKPGTLDFLKVPYQRNNADGPRAFQ